MVMQPPLFSIDMAYFDCDPVTEAWVLPEPREYAPIVRLPMWGAFVLWLDAVVFGEYD